MEKNIPLGKPMLGDEELRLVEEALRSGWILNGPKVVEFEERFRKYIGSAHAVSVTSCTAGMHLALAALGVGRGDEIILPAFNFIAPGLAVLQNNAKPVFIDVDPITCNIDIAKVENGITEGTKAILLCHFAGHAADMDPVIEMAANNGIYVVEDAAHALGSEYKGRRVGTLGDITVFSFGPLKMMTTAMGGMVTTEDSMIARKLRVLRNYGMDKSAWEREKSESPWKYSISRLGHNFRMTDISAAMGIAQLHRLDDFVGERREYSKYLTERLSGIKGIETPVELRGYKHSYLYYVIKINEDFALTRDELAKRLMQKGIGSRVHWDPPLHLHPLFRRQGYKKGDFPIAEDLSRKVLTLPMHPGLSYEDLDYMIKAVEE